MEPEIEVGNIPIIVSRDSISIEIELGKTFNINSSLSPSLTEWLLKILQENKGSFSWEYTNMKGISTDLCTHHIYIKQKC